MSTSHQGTVVETDICVVRRATFLISAIISEGLRSPGVSNEQIFVMTSSIYVERPGLNSQNNESVRFSTHLDLEVFAETNIVSHAIEA